MLKSFLATLRYQPFEFQPPLGKGGDVARTCRGLLHREYLNSDVGYDSNILYGTSAPSAQAFSCGEASVSRQLMKVL